MRRAHLAMIASTVLVTSVGATLLGLPGGTLPTTAQGVGQASWTPSQSTTTSERSRFLTSGDSIIYRTDVTWDRQQADGLAGYIDAGLRYTHEVNDRSGRLSATGFWATNHPDPAYDRDDDDGDGRWEEAEITAGATRPTPGQRYTEIVQFSRWHAKRQKGACDWTWDRRRGTTEVLSQLSRELLGEWQAERYTLTYERLEFPRAGKRPRLPKEIPDARCRDVDAGPGQSGFVVTFAEPLAWDAFVGLPGAGRAKWTAFEAIGSSRLDGSTWTCGGPVTPEARTRPCKALGVEIDGVTAAVGYLDDEALARLDGHRQVVEIEELQDALTGLLYEIGGLGVERPGLTIDDRYWDLFLSD
jgi:hypothetical protein